MELIHQYLNLLMPFEWANYTFMRNALIAVLLMAPVFALLGTMVISQRMVFFSDVLGHSALTGIAIGVLLGIKDPGLSILGFAVIVAVLVSLSKGVTLASFDTIMGVFLYTIIAVGIVVLSRKGGFARFTSFLIGDILSVTPAQMVQLVFVAVLVFGYWFFFANRLVLLSVNPSLLQSRGESPKWIEISFAVLVAIVVSFSIRFIGILIINAFLVLPAACARMFSRSIRSYTMISMILSLSCGITGLLLSFYWGTAAGATIVLCLSGIYLVSVLGLFLLRKIRT